MIFASFVVIFVGNKVCATTRLDENKIGFPGGKLNSGEDSLSSALRESEEEGWLIDDIQEVHKLKSVNIENKIIDFFYIIANNVIQLNDFKEKDRGIKPILIDINEFNSWSNQDIILEAISLNKEKVKACN